MRLLLGALLSGMQLPRDTDLERRISAIEALEAKREAA
jgi:hypothetical protein